MILPVIEVTEQMMQRATLSVVIPCYNEENTLEKCVSRVLGIADDDLALEILIVDDASTDKSLALAQGLEQVHENIKVFVHSVNMGKGAALRTGFQQATGDFVAVQDADLEYDPADLKRLLKPLKRGEADVVLGSRFLTSGAHRVFYFWHSVGNKFLTLLSNMLTDLNLTDMETCYKVFRREVIQSVEIRENRFGFEPEVVAEIAHKRLRIFEMGISYAGRTYAEGKKIGVRDGFRAIYCILRYNAFRVNVVLQFFVYLLLGGTCALVNWGLFAVLMGVGTPVVAAVMISYFFAGLGNYQLCVSILFHRGRRWSLKREVVFLGMILFLGALIDLLITTSSLHAGTGIMLAKALGSLACLFPNFLARKYLLFNDQGSRSWS